MLKRFFKDSTAGYGWGSIILHWLTAVVIITMLFLGDSIDVSGRDMLSKHIRLGLLAYPLLWLRIIMRFAIGHPRRLPTQTNAWLYQIAVWTHYALIVALAVLLVTGPLIAISRGGYEFAVLKAITLPEFMLRAPSYHTIHAYTAAVVAIGIAIHVLAVLKHAVWNRDGTLEKMIIPYGDRDNSDKEGANKNGGNKDQNIETLS